VLQMQYLKYTVFKIHEVFKIHRVFKIHDVVMIQGRLRQGRGVSARRTPMSESARIKKPAGFPAGFCKSCSDASLEASHSMPINYQAKTGELMDVPPAATVMFSPSAQISSLIRNLQVTSPFACVLANDHS